MGLANPCLGLCPYSTSYLGDETGRPRKPRLVRDGLKDIGGVLDDLGGDDGARFLVSPRFAASTTTTSSSPSSSTSIADEIGRAHV